MSESLAFFRGSVVPISEAKVSVMTHALHYGTAVFEGIRGNWNEAQGKMFVFRMREHYDRLIQGCRIMMLDIPYTAEQLCDITVDLIQKCGYKQDVYIRPLAYKSEELVANLKLQDLESDFTLVIVPFGAYIDTDGAIRCCTSSWRRMDDTIIPPRVKISGHYVNSIIARYEANEDGFDEALMLDGQGNVAEGTGENVFVVKNGVVSTPPATNILPGITRDTCMEILAHEGVEVREQAFARDAFYVAEEAWMVGTAAEVTPIRELDRRVIGIGSPGPVTRMLQEVYGEAVRGKVEWLRHHITVCE